MQQLGILMPGFSLCTKGRHAVVTSKFEYYDLSFKLVQELQLVPWSGCLWEWQAGYKSHFKAASLVTSCFLGLIQGAYSYSPGQCGAQRYKRMSSSNMDLWVRFAGCPTQERSM